MNNNMKYKKRTKPTVYINVAPLVDVMLVLIIIFMITAPMLNVGVQVDLPKTKASTMNDTKTPPIVISIDKDSNIFIEEAQISLEDLVQKLPHILENGKSDAVYIRGDKDLQYGKVMEIMGIISSSGNCKVSLISEPDNSPIKNANDKKISKETPIKNTKQKKPIRKNRRAKKR